MTDVSAAKLRWKRNGRYWSLGPEEQVLLEAVGKTQGYKITRSGTADKPTWTLYTRQPDGTEEPRVSSNLLRLVKGEALRIERGLR